jgi:uncharacterized protein (TIGR03067 family)
MKLRGRIFFLTALACLSAAPAGRVHADDGKADAQGIQGEWKVVEAVLGGKPAPEQLYEQFTFVFTAEKLTLGSNASKREFNYQIDPAKKPRQMTLTPLDGPHKGKSVSGIYELKEDDLKLCLPNDDGQAPPVEFKSAEGSKIGLFVLKRGK